VVQAQQDYVTITTYFPSPNGVFSYMRARRAVVSPNLAFAGGDGTLVWGGANSMGRLQTDQGSSIELGNSAGGTPFVVLTKGAVTSTIRLMNDNLLYIYVWANCSIYDLAQTTWKDLRTHAVHYHWGWMNGTIEQTNLQYL